MNVKRYVVSDRIPDTFIITYLHMTDRAQFKPAYITEPGMTIKRLEQPSVPFYRFLYDSVGDELRWRDRRLMTDEELYAAITDPAVSIYVLYLDG